MPGHLILGGFTSLNSVTIVKCEVQANTERTMFVTWNFDLQNVDHYVVKWEYDTGNGVWFDGTTENVTIKQHVYNAPSNAVSVRVKIKPVAKEKKKNGIATIYWTGGWCNWRQYWFPVADPSAPSPEPAPPEPPATPSAPSVELKDLRITARLSNIDSSVGAIRFQVIRDDTTVFADQRVNTVINSASFSCNVNAGSSYKVRCLAIKNVGGAELTSEWSSYSSICGTPPNAINGGIKSIQALSETSVSLSWEAVPTATSYEVEYTDNVKYFDTSNTVNKTTVQGTTAIITGLETGSAYAFRVRSVNADGSSAWTELKGVILGKEPAAPTTWSSSTTVMIGGDLTLYWNHNSQDGSSQRSSELELIINGVKRTYTINNDNPQSVYRINADGDLEVIWHGVEDSTDTTTSSNFNEVNDKITSCEVVVSGYTEGAVIQWRVRTSGITAVYGDWSAQRTIDVYAPPTLELGVRDKDGNVIETLTTFPFYITGIAGPSTQKPIGYQVSVVAEETYETVDQIGNTQIIKKGDEVYSAYFNTSGDLSIEMSAGNIDLENNITYTVRGIVSMDSGLTGESSSSFVVYWGGGSYYNLNAEIGVNPNTLAAIIRPYCVDENENLIEGILLSVYRREFDGSFITLMENIENTSNTWIPDPHPALDYARYRIVAKSETTGSISYYDLPGYPIGEKSVIIQWDEKWSSFNVFTEDALAEPEWSGSMLKLPYNIDVSESNSSDVSVVPYIGRKHPVSYYGTQLGTESVWNVDIEKTDKETIYALRRLAVWMGNVYVREPSGLGYWAHIKVSFSQKHGELTIPVTLDITRVEGGV